MSSKFLIFLALHLLFFISIPLDADGHSLSVSHRQIDTLVARCIRPYQIFSRFYDYRAMKTEGDLLVLEYLMFRKASDALYEEMKMLSSVDVEKMIRFSGTRVFNALVSIDFWSTYQRLVKEAEEDKKFDYEIRNEQYADLPDRLKNDYAYLYFRANALAKGSILPHTDFSTGDGWLKPLPQNVKDKLPVLLVKTLMRYITYDEFVSSGVESGVFLAPVAEKLSDASRIFIDTKKEEKIDSVLNSPVLVEDIAEYMKLAHCELPFLDFFVNNYGQFVCNLAYRKGTYTGYTCDGLPEGPGSWTDKKERTYCGNFKNGQFHGCIQVTSHGKESVQCWYKGKLQKSVPVGRNRDGSVPEVGSIKGKKFGYGYVYNPRTRAAEEGFFVDGHLWGAGNIDTPEYTVKGSFYDDAVVNCNMVWKGTKWKKYYFIGEKNGNLLSGAISKVSRDGSRTELYMGEFVARQQDGHGSVRISNKNDTIQYDGWYAYGQMYGEAVITRLLGRTKTAGHQKAVYEGNVFRYKPHGKGTVEIELRDIIDDSFKISRYGVRLREYVGQSDATIRMEGYFKDGNLVEGKVTVSNGSLMIGRFVDGRLAEGRMLKKYKDGSIYDGECRDGKYHGYGSLTYADGTVYEGLFENGCSVEKTPEYALDPDKQKKLREALRDRRQGNDDKKVFRFDGLPVEKGVVRLVHAAGVKIMVRGMSEVEVECKGRFDGETMTEGEVTVSDGNWMEGTFENGILIRGRARTLDKYGTVYVGDIRNGFPHGRGKCTYKNGTWFEGNFANGNRMQGTHYTADGEVIKVYK